MRKSGISVLQKEPDYFAVIGKGVLTVRRALPFKSGALTALFSAAFAGAFAMAFVVLFINRRIFL